ncbi:hypothetical protein CS0771_76700 [Catellatospora sp. IY07-71]|uniref:hypothetical protein n=1 Tax=Catellatospora sp. IY07-71 TaxID=2728827 RepID=UPI001BB3140C|nr:hypothetical protein [Catellatospora sp. IY07-71]BCJ78126.1 hypothetical protein CS0771_76700 [Catellatospora sp. IY07-71]
MRDPLVGLWRGAFGDGTLVEIVGTPAAYAVTSLEPYPKRRLALRRIPAGSAVALLHRTGGSSYGGVHGRWWETNLRLAEWSAVWLTLDPRGMTLSGTIAGTATDPGAFLSYRRALAEERAHRAADRAWDVPPSLAERDTVPNLERPSGGPVRKAGSLSDGLRLRNRRDSY